MNNGSQLILPFADPDCEKMLLRFQEKIVGHARQKEALEELRELVSCSLSSNVIAVVGPELSGRNTLVDTFLKPLHERLGATAHSDHNWIPVIDVSVPGANPKTGEVEWGRVPGEILRQAGHPLMGGQLYVPGPEQYHQQAFVARLEDRTRISRLAQQIQVVLRERKTRLLIFRNADKLFRPDVQRKSTAAIDTLFDVVGHTGVIIILVGSYDLIDIAGETGRWLNSKATIHVRRYDSEDSEDLKQYLRTLEALLQHLRDLGIEHELSMKTHGKGFYLRTLGRIGALSTLLAEALNFHLITKRKLNWELVEERASAVKYLFSQLCDIQKGEAKLLDDPIQLLEQRLKHGGEPPVAAAPRQSVTARRRIGERHPRRDATGAQHAK